MDKINFTGGFSLVKLKPKNYNKFYNEIMPDTHYISTKIFDDSKLFFAVSGKYDNEVATYLFKHGYVFNYYPNVKIESLLKLKSDEDAVKTIVRAEKAISDPNKIKNAVKETDKKSIPAGYNGRACDYLDKTIKALKTIEYISVDNLKHVTNGNFTTEFRDSKNRLVAIASPNNTRGFNFIKVFPRYSDEMMEMLKVSHTGDICYRTTDISKLRRFNRDFIGAVLTAAQ